MPMATDRQAVLDLLAPGVERLGSPRRPRLLIHRLAPLRVPASLDMTEVWQRTQECIPGALSAAGASPADVAGIGITDERETVVLWDRRTGRPVAPFITWQDTRTGSRTS